MRGSNRARRFAGVVALAVASLAGCGGGEEGELGGSAGSRGGTDPVQVDTLPRIGLVEQLRIGSLEDPEVGFSQIGPVQFAPDGRLFVLELSDMQIRVYAPDGTLLHRIGREGDGPGEFRGPVINYGLVGDTVWAIDFPTNRVTLFTSTGELLATVPPIRVEFPVDRPDTRVLITPQELRPDGLIVGTPMLQGSLRDGDPDSLRVPTLLFDLTGAVVDTARWRWASVGGAEPRRGRALDLRDPMAEELATFIVDDLMRTVERLRDEAPLRRTVRGDTLVVERPSPVSGESGEARVLRLAPSGDTLFRARLRYRPRAIPPAYLDSLVQSALDRLPPSIDLSELERAIRAQLPPLPAFQSAIGFPLAGVNGSIWVQWVQEDPTVQHWIVLGPDGSARGTVELPASASLRRLEESTVWAVERDALDVPWIVRYRLQLEG